MYGSQYGAPGGRAMGTSAKILSAVKGQRQRLNIYALCLSLFLPWLLFTLLAALLSFETHYTSPGLCYVGAGAALFAVFMCGVSAFVAVRARAAGEPGREPTWMVFIFVTSLIAWVSAVSLGNRNFWQNMQPFFDIQNLGSYPSVDTARTRGQQLMDAGRIHFVPGTHLDTSKAMGFKNLDLYCVAPIVHGEEQLASYDFWAVGLNCCSGVSSDFRCGEFNNPHARSGLRLMRDDQRPFFRLAVQQAEAAYNIKATHPLFFYWMQDPVAEMNSYRDDGFKYYLLGIFTHFAFNLFCVVVGVVGFSKIGRY